MTSKKLIMFAMIFLAGILMTNLSSAAGVNATVCCEKTITNLYCQNVPANQCSPNSKQVPTACESTSYCKPGTCFDSNEGICLDNTPQLVCNANKGIWNENHPQQCELGCCVLGDQAAFVSLVRCKKLSSFLGLQTNFNKEIKDEVQCIQSVRNEDKGACVYEFEGEKTCKIITRKECNENVNKTDVVGEFFKGKLCSAEELGTKCGPTKQTTCIPGREEVYFVDSCGNPSNIYDATKLNDKDYWSNIKDKTKSCNPKSTNANSASCGNCNYLEGSFCRKSGNGNARASYGNYVCADLNCKNTENGKSYKHGESWCVYDDKGQLGVGKNAVGSRFYKHICINGEEVLEQCADFRQEECIESSIKTSVTFSQAGCRVNRWRECTSQSSKLDCENTDKRDCLWTYGSEEVPVTEAAKGQASLPQFIACIPKNAPGIKFWEGEEAKSICSQGNSQCIATCEKGLFSDKKCKADGCVDDKGNADPFWTASKLGICTSLGDCGDNINWIGTAGYKQSYTINSKSKKSG